MILVVFHVQTPDALPIGQALISGEGAPGPWQGLTNSCGDFKAGLTPAHYELTVTAPGYAPRKLPADIAECGEITIGLEYSTSGPGISGTVRVEGNRFFDANGPIRPIFVTGFDLPRLNVTGESRFDRYLDWVTRIGANGVRMFGNWIVTDFDYRNVEDYFPHLDTCFYRLTVRGLAGEFTALCDCQPSRLNITPDQQRSFLNDACALVESYPQVILEGWNEGWNNGAIDMRRPVTRALLAYSAPETFRQPHEPTWGYSTIHQPRDDEWYRKVGKDCGIDAQEVNHDAILVNEPMKQSIDGDPANWTRAGYNVAMFCAGVVIHGNSDTMQRCIVPGKDEEACVRAMLDAAKSVPIDAPTWRYTRNGLSGMPVSNTEGRVYAKVDDAGGRACVLNMYDDDWTPHVQDGWKIATHDGPYCELGR